MSKYLLLVPVLLFLFFNQEVSGQVPVIKVRFNNPVVNTETGKYCVDVEFQSDTEGLELFGMNVRFFYDDAVLELSSFGDFTGGYRSTQNPPSVLSGSLSSGVSFGFSGAADFVNGVIQLVSTGSPVYLSSTSWTKLFTACFTVDNPMISNPGDDFCPSLVWDLEQNPQNGSFFPGSNGVVMTAVNPAQKNTTINVSEQVEQFNWVYSGPPNPPWGAPVKANCIQFQGQCTIDLRTGWNIFSSCVVPFNPDLEVICQTLISEGKLIKVQDKSGNSFEDLGFLGGWTNNIGDIKITEGYKIKVNADCRIIIPGTPATLPVDIPLISGWNIIGYPRTSEADGLAVVQQLIDRGTLLKVQDELGFSIEDLGFLGGWINDIGNFKPGEGYKVKVIAAENLTIYESYPKSSASPMFRIAPVHFKPIYAGNGVDHMNIILTDIPPDLLQSGDEIAIFDGNLCVGAKVFGNQYSVSGANKSEIRNPQSAITGVPVSANDGLGESGFTEGHPFTIRIWKSSAGREYSAQPVILKGSPTFLKHESALVSLKNFKIGRLNGLTIDGSGNIRIYPNPTKGKTYIHYSGEDFTGLHVSVVNALGQQIMNQTLQSNPGEIDLSGNETGIYHIRVAGDEWVETRKIILR